MFSRLCLAQSKQCFVVHSSQISATLLKPAVFTRLPVNGVSKYSTLASRCRNITKASLWPKQITPRLVAALRQTTTKAGEAVPKRAFPDITPHAQKRVGQWLAVCSGMVFGTLIVGGLTRLTESGLSITKWDPITGSVLPRSEKDWNIEFDKYKQTPEYKYLERDLTMSDFKFIYFMEWFHRNWGRMTGMVFLLPAIYFWRKGYIAKSMKKRVLIYGGLIGLQGCMGIFMVNSGLENWEDKSEVPRVSQYRLASHLGLALFIYVNFLWSSMNHLLPDVKNISKYVKTNQIRQVAKFAHTSMALVFFTALSGAFVAGLDAGLVYNNWPKMADRWIPTDILAFEPKWKNFFENHTTVQFNHRHLGEATGLLILATWVLCRRAPLPPRAKTAANVLAGMATLQVILGITTLVHFVPTWLAASHQSGSVLLLSFSAWLVNELKRIPK